MNTGNPRSVRRSRRRWQARNWFVIHQSQREFPLVLLKKWQKWAADERNLAEYRAYVRVDSILRALPRVPRPTPAELREEAALTVAEMLMRAGDAVAQKRRAYLMAGCAVALIALSASILAPHLRALLKNSVAIQERDYQTPSGASLDLLLKDGSGIKLSGLTHLTVRYSNGLRQVTLTTGEALFNVAHDPLRPFQVDAGATRTTALGTSFDIRRYSDQQVIVAVTDGVVAVAPRESSGDQVTGIQPHPPRKPRAVTVTRGEEVTSNARGELSSPHAVTLWSSGYRVYSDKPLEQVIEDMQLYSVRTIEYDSRLRGFLFSGRVDPTNTEEWARGLHYILPVAVDSNPQRLVIRCRTNNCELRR